MALGSEARVLREPSVEELERGFRPSLEGHVAERLLETDDVVAALLRPRRVGDEPACDGMEGASDDAGRDRRAGGPPSAERTTTARATVAARPATSSAAATRDGRRVRRGCACSE